jgi:2-iminobutanoate/2-iminopropanoate deaminase
LLLHHFEKCVILILTHDNIFIKLKIILRSKCMIETISTDKAPAAIGPYSQAIRAGSMVYISGQLPVNPATGALVENDIAIQTARSLDNIQAILATAGLTMANVVKTTVFLKDMSEFAAMNEVYAKYFNGIYPARAAVQAAALPKDARVEIEAVAFCG